MAYGKKNHVNPDPLSYNIMLLGESKVGKTTLVKEVCEKLAGDNGYLFLECGQERGADAIEGINHINCPAWNGDYDELSNSIGFIDVCEDIIENKVSEYPDLKVVVWDTYDQLINLAEQESVRLWNKDCRESGSPEKTTKSINAAWGGFGKGEKKAIELMLDTMARMKQVGVSTFIIGHVKNKDVSDVVSGETYQILTSDQQQNYFNAIKKNLHFMGLAFIDRQIIKEKTGRKNPVNNKEKVVSKVSTESRKIKFRDDSYAVDSGSRFADIIPEIDMNADAFIQALKDAIESEQRKTSGDAKSIKVEQERIEKAKQERVAKQEKEAKEREDLDNVITQIVEYFTQNKSNISVVKPIIAKMKEMGYAKPKDINDINDANAILSMIE